MATHITRKISRRGFAAAVISVPAILGLAGCGEEKSKTAPQVGSPTSAVANATQLTQITVAPIGDEQSVVMLTVYTRDDHYVYDVQMPALKLAEGIKPEFEAKNEQPVELGVVSLKSRGEGKVYFGGKSLLDRHQDQLHEVKKVPAESTMGSYVVLENEGSDVFAVVFADQDVVKVEATAVRDIGLPKNYLANEVFTIGRGA